ncbi:hypothetical protein [Rhizosaccharibacter radicis]|uniref:DUF1440 domain-containing protein n=1 Tax=Rhizosaccharibacter radicis TaxID=2782605 RepID=A0ABT1VTP6_9PROT|nr:hypothetical protein [Acetobacteraceae bacterium KSS12]
MLAGAAGGTVGGLLISALMLGIERLDGGPNELVVLGRRAAEALGSPYRYNPAHPAVEEQLMSHGGHLLLSALLGALYPPARRLPGPDGALGGLVFGAGVYAALWGVVGPALRLTPTPRQEGAAVVARRLGIHLGFGLVTALIAGRLERSASR